MQDAILTSQKLTYIELNRENWNGKSQRILKSHLRVKTFSILKLSRKFSGLSVYASTHVSEYQIASERDKCFYFLAHDKLGRELYKSSRDMHEHDNTMQPIYYSY